MTAPGSLLPDAPAERMGLDDRVTRAEEEHRAAALLRQSQRAACKRSSEPGVCTNCGSPCLPLAVYCDTACRDDHERRIKRGAT
jgi:hypothetical protein